MSLFNRIPLTAAKISILASASLIATACFGESVVVEGKAAGSTSAARAEALGDALREAVRTGAGVELISQTQTSNFSLDFDRVFAKACGYVRNYKVLSSRLGEDGIYIVKISADVARGNPDMDDRLALQMLARLKQMPRVAVRIEESIKGASTKGMAADWLQNAASEIGLQVVDLGKTQGVDNAMAKRAAILGRDKEASLRGQGAMDSADFIIEGTVIGENLGSQSVYGGLPKPRFSLAVNLKVIEAATGNVIVVENPESRDLLISGTTSADTAAREAVRMLLDGNQKENRVDAGWKLFRRLFANWTAEFDLGQTVRVDLAEANLDTVNRLKEDLAKEDHVGAIWVRSIDSAGIGVIDVESRMETTTLASRIAQILSGRYSLDRSGARYLSFVPGGGGIKPLPTSQAAHAPASETSAPVVLVQQAAPTSQGISPMIVALIAFVSILSAAFLVIIIILLKKK